MVKAMSRKIDLDEVEFITETTVTIRGSRRRTTVPSRIVEYFQLRDGDILRWILFRDGSIIIMPKHRGE